MGSDSDGAGYGEDHGLKVAHLSSSNRMIDGHDWHVVFGGVILVCSRQRAFFLDSPFASSCTFDRRNPVALHFFASKGL